MSRLINLVGQKFGRLTVIERDTKYEKSVRGNSAYWRCKCDCGNYKTVSSIHLKMVIQNRVAVIIKSY